MKKLACLLLALASVGCMAGCSADSENTSATELSYGVKYIATDDVAKEEDEQSYFIFLENGVAKWHVYSVLGSSIKYVYSYTITCKYKNVEEENMVFLFFDSIEYDVAHNEDKNISSASTCTLMYTEDFMMNAKSGEVYLAEDFASEELPNFGK
ncbi:MAG: hypothetical protein IJY11_00335 [Clostridia bacterium]|nr:hypothetical protein [Clostridia bacterium]